MIVKEFFSRRMFVVFGRPSSVICQLFLFLVFLTNEQ